MWNDYKNIIGIGQTYDNYISYNTIGDDFECSVLLGLGIVHLAKRMNISPEKLFDSLKESCIEGYNDK